MLKSEKSGKSVDDDVAYRVGTIHVEVGIMAVGWVVLKKRADPIFPYFIKYIISLFSF